MNFIKEIHASFISGCYDIWPSRLWRSGPNPIRTAPDNVGRESGNQVSKQRIRSEDDLQYDTIPNEQG